MSERRSAPAAVFKLGGSLLNYPLLEVRLRRLLTPQRDVNGGIVFVVGGGRAVDEVRELDRVYGLGDAAAHDLALRAMEWTAHLAGTLLRPLKLEITDRFADLASAASEGRPLIFSTRLWFCEEGGDVGLPHTWDVTSDTIAARVAQRLGGSELFLLKSVPPPVGCDVERASQLGLVDRWFPIEASGLSISYVNMRSNDQPSVEPLPWRHSPSDAKVSSSSEANRDST